MWYNPQQQQQFNPMPIMGGWNSQPQQSAPQGYRPPQAQPYRGISQQAGGARPQTGMSLGQQMTGGSTPVAGPVAPAPAQPPVIQGPPAQPGPGPISAPAQPNPIELQPPGQITSGPMPQPIAPNPTQPTQPGQPTLPAGITPGQTYYSKDSNSSGFGGSWFTINSDGTYNTGANGSNAIMVGKIGDNNWASLEKALPNYSTTSPWANLTGQSDGQGGFTIGGPGMQGGIMPLNPSDAANLPPGVGITLMGQNNSNGANMFSPSWGANGSGIVPIAPNPGQATTGSTL